MKIKAERRGMYPEGVHWTPGEVRDLDLDPKELPPWLKPQKPKKKPAGDK